MVVAAEADAATRHAWWEALTALNPATAGFIDESGANEPATPRYGWARKGHRATGIAPRNYDQNPPVLAALTTHGIRGALSFPGALDSEAVDVCVEQVLARRLVPGQPVLMDNFSVHRRSQGRTRIGAAHCDLVYLPPYSPDANPIELAFSKLQTYLRRAQARTHEVLDAALSAWLATITPADAQAWIRHCSYALPRQRL